ncbi:MarR family winged helix-turn-helix transcriptional regulator [Weeksellaceae bacterium TAE3-ERU29]|nr:MarR family winged helix-turn-helix transcriptional regulator [Weeksellaceae bacterium TAE3-ERU29]
MNYSLLKIVISELEKFQNSEKGENATLDNFRNYLNEQAYLKESPKNISEQVGSEEPSLNNEICKQLLMMGRYAKFALKKGLTNQSELINEDFTYLYRLSDYPQLTKMQLIEKNAHDKQYGLVIINRLLKHKLIDEKINPDDRREKFIYITEKGKQIVENSFEDVSRTARLISGNLSKKEKQQLLNLLKKLSTFHHFIYDNYKDAEMEQIEQLLKQ